MKEQEKSKIKINLHPKNKNRKQYDFKKLVKKVPNLKKYIRSTINGEDTIQFSDPSAVKLLNKALLISYYGINNWDFPDNNLCPPIPSRADYIHYISDLLKQKKDVTCLDIGVGANCIYPIIGISEYKWDFIASDINTDSISCAKKIINTNPSLKGKVKFRLQKDENNIFNGIIKPKDRFDVSICNPPFHASKEEALKGSMRKARNLTGKKSKKIKGNFSGMSNEIITEGGEKQFINNMINESVKYADNCLWFTTLVSNEKNLNRIYSSLEKIKVSEVKTINMSTANKISRIVAWTFKEKKKN